MKCTLVIVLLLLFSCVKDRSFDRLESPRISNLVANTTYAELKEHYTGETVQIKEELIIEGYVISSDAAGNFFSVLHFQDQPEQPTAGFQIEIDQRDSHIFFPAGSKIFINLKGLYLGKSKDVFKIGGAFTSFGNISVGRLPATVIDQHIFLSEEEQVQIQPSRLSIENLEKSLTNTLVMFEAVQFAAEDLGELFAIQREATKRILQDCEGNNLTVLNSGFSDFQSELLPSRKGNITGVLLRERDKFQLVIRSLDDINFNKERCVQIEGKLK